MYESFDEYKKYLERNKEKLPPHVYDFAIDVNRHNLDSPHSLHDSWMTSITIQENRNEVRPFDPKPTIEIVLLGQRHDRDIVLKYEGVEFYQLEGIKNPYNWGDTFQGDVSCHEVIVNDEGHLVHEILFASESSIIIVCQNFDCSESVHT